MATVGDAKMTSAKSTEAEETKTASEGAKDSSTKTATEYVKYSGGASRREITTVDWKKAGVTGMKADSNWTFANGFQLPVTDFSESALHYLLNEKRSNGTRSFKIVSE